MCIFSVRWQIFIVFSDFRSASNIVYFGLSMLWNIFESFFNVNFFANVTSSGTSSFFFSQPLSLLILVDRCLLSSPGFISRLYWTALVCTFPWPALSFFIPLRLTCISLPLLSLLLSLLSFYLCWPISFFDIHFCNMSHGFITEGHALLSMCELNNRCAVTNQRHDVKKNQWLITDCKALVLFT